MFCNGTGLMNDPYYLGKSIGLCSSGKSYLTAGLYKEAFDAFSQAMELENIEAIFFLGVCYELGMGVPVNHELAHDCYTLSGEYGYTESKTAIDRINQNGYWHATDETRKNFSNNLKALMDIKYNATIINSNNTSNRDNYDNHSGNYGCHDCRGTGKCTSCKGTGKVIYDTGYYVGKDIKTLTDCPICKGSGNCGVCYGKGSVR